MLVEISRILAWYLAARNKQRFANAALTQPIQIPPIMTAAGVRVEWSTTRAGVGEVWAPAEMAACVWSQLASARPTAATTP